MSKNKNDTVILNLDRPRELKFTHSALKKAVAMTEMSLEEIEEKGFSDFGVVEKLAYCAMLRDARDQGENLKLEDMEDILDQAETWADIVNAVSRAFMYAFGVDPDQQPVGNQQPAEMPEIENRRSTLTSQDE